MHSAAADPFAWRPSGLGAVTDAQSWRSELESNILPWWAALMQKGQGWPLSVSAEHGERAELPRTTVLAGRLLWTFASAVQHLQVEHWRGPAQTAFGHLQHALWDSHQGGWYWSIDAAGHAPSGDKFTYAQAFGIYGCSAWAKASGERAALLRAQQAFGLLNQHAADPQHGGYWDACARDWRPIASPRLSPTDVAADKTTNTQLHVLEAFTVLYQAWPDRSVADSLRKQFDLVRDRLWLDPVRAYGTHFHADWQIIAHPVSPGHDIETAWLMCRAAEVLGDVARLQQAHSRALVIADELLGHGLNAQGLVTDKARPAEYAWWAQAEAIVGLWEVWQCFGEQRHRQAAQRLWALVKRHFVDGEQGDWHKLLGEDLKPLPGSLKAGPWECPYHHARACFEMMNRTRASS